MGRSIPALFTTFLEHRAEIHCKEQSGEHFTVFLKQSRIASVGLPR
jgi:hypothetical protein